MFRIRKIVDDGAPANRSAIERAQEIIRVQFPGLPESKIAKLPEQLHDPMRFRFRTALIVAEDSRDRVRACAVLRFAPDLDFGFLDLISAAPGKTGGGMGGVLYERVREDALALGCVGLFFECLPDEPALCPDPEVRKQNANRLRFYERFGARPIANTAYETPMRPGDTNPPYLVFDPLGRSESLSKSKAQAIVRAILERIYGDVCPPGYIDMVVNSIKDDPIRLRPPKYVRKEPQREVKPIRVLGPRVPLVVNDKHHIHHMRDRGYVQAPVRISSILSEIMPIGLFEQVQPRHFTDRHIRAVHDGALVDYIEKACRNVAPGKSIYPYVFPIRNAARPPKERTVRAGYYCIDTFTPLNANAFLAARRAVDCTMTAAERVLEGAPAAYALVRPPGHHAERKAFGGFCYFNNAGIAAHYLSRYGRVAVLDIDYHHGNGTQDIFFERSDVLTVSIHGHPSFAYPYFSGFKDETGIGPGAGYNLNIPLPETITPDDYRAALKTALNRIAKFDPTYLVMAVGFDTARGDPTGTWTNRADDFQQIGHMLGATGYPLLIVQEGGYRVRTLGVNARRFFMGLADGAAAAKPRPRRRKPEPRPAGGGTIVWRETAEHSDIEAVRALVAETGFFKTEEVAIATELVTERVNRGPVSGYEFIFAQDNGSIAGYACYGPIAGTQASYDLYWIVVRPGRQREGIGRTLLTKAEEAIAAAGGKQIYVDTSSTELYAPTRRFYRASGYRKITELSDFYRAGDGKVIFQRTLIA
jgi:acetoin utilization deacetylase AcuC-like enzyme/ribosomal protein S18 acetylase RimI-like enzyme